VELQTVIDVGASNGSWSAICLRYFPLARYFLVEAQQLHEPGLKRFCRAHSNSDYLLAAAGDANGVIHFDNSSLFGGAASKEAKPGLTTVPMITIDEQVRSRNLPPPFLLKLDTHGFEIPIFEGARETLQQTALIVVETYNFKLHPSALRFTEMCNYLEGCGFRCVDMSDPLYRPGDGVLWQFDLYFMPQYDPVFTSNTYL
jgi:FkbM family methyltransferase